MFDYGLLFASSDCFIVRSRGNVKRYYLACNRFTVYKPTALFASLVPRVRYRPLCQRWRFFKLLGGKRNKNIVSTIKPLLLACK